LLLAPGTNTHARHLGFAGLATVVAFLVSVLAVACTGDASQHLTFIEVHRDGEAGVDGLDGTISLAVSPDSKYLYSVGVRDNAVAVFSVAIPEISGAEDHE
jgi:hypothetical protein